jgi:xanthine/uracil permease
MYQFLRKQLGIFLAGFVVAFIIYLFWKLDGNELLIGVLIGIAAGLALTIALSVLERRFPESKPPQA